VRKGNSAGQLLAVGIGLCLALLLAVLSAQVVPVAAGEAAAAYEQDQIVVKLNPGAAVAAVNASYGTTTAKVLLGSASVYLLQTPPGVDADQLKESMSGDPRLAYAEFNYIGAAPEASASGIFGWPDDEADPRLVYEWQWAGGDSGRYYNQPAVHRTNLSQAHAVSRGAGAVVAVLDTGIDLNHPVLSGSLTQARYDFVDDDGVPEDAFNNVDDDGDGFVDEAGGHGTHVVGIVHLVAPEARLMPLRVLDSDGQGNIFIVAEAIIYAVNHGASVINLSMGTWQSSTLLQDVLDEVTASGVVVVGAAGNLNADVPQYPAAAACALAVTAVNPGLVKSTYASYGQWVDLAAPGDRIYSTYPDNGFAWWKGTSMATPFVAGQAALIRSADPDLSLEDVGMLISNTARPVDKQNPQYKGLLGTGQVDIGGSLEYLANGLWPASASNPLQSCAN